MDNDDEIPEEYLDVFTYSIIRDPVVFVTPNNVRINYERRSILRWIGTTGKCPSTRLPLSEADLQEDDELRARINDYIQNNRERCMRILQRQQYRNKLQRDFNLGNWNVITRVVRNYVCGIDFSIMANPFTAADGHNYEGRNIRAWIKLRKDAGYAVVSPMTRQPMEDTLTENADLQQEISDFLAQRYAIPNPNGEEDGAHELVHPLNSIFEVLDGLQDVLHEILDRWEPANVVVMGNQSHGKSSILERICRMPIFPRNHIQCTRLPVKVCIRRGAQQQPVTLQMWNTVNNAPMGDVQIVPIGNGELDVREAMETAMRGFGAGELRTDVELRIRIVSPTLPPMNLVDLPGLIELPPKAYTASHELVERYINTHQDSSTYLLVMKADTGPQAAGVLRHVLTHQVTNRSIGVFTFCDKLNAGGPFDSLRGWLTNADDVRDNVTLHPYGYVATMNEDVEIEPDHPYTVRFNQLVKNEKAWFQLNKFDDLQNVECVGIQALIKKIEHMHRDHVFNSFVPATVKRLCLERLKCSLQLDLLGSPVERNDVIAPAADLARTLLTPCVEGAREMFSRQVLTPLHAALLATVPDNIVACERTFGARLETIQQEILQHVLNLGDQVREAWTALCARALSNNDAPFRLQRFRAYVTSLTNHCNAIAPRLNDNTMALVQDFVNRSVATTSHFMDIDLDFGDFPSAITIHCRQRQLVNGIVTVVADGFVGPSLADLGAIDAIVQESFAGDQAEVEACHGTRVELHDRFAKIEDAMQRLIELADEHQQDAEADELTAEPPMEANMEANVERNTDAPIEEDMAASDAVNTDVPIEANIEAVGQGIVARAESEEEVQERLDVTLLRVFPHLSPALVDADLYHCQIEGTMTLGLLSTIIVTTVTRDGDRATGGGLPLSLLLVVGDRILVLALVDNNDGTYMARHTIYELNVTEIECAVIFANLDQRYAQTSLRVRPCRVITIEGSDFNRGGARATFGKPYDVAVGKDGTVFVADGDNAVVRAVTPIADVGPDDVPRFSVSTVAGTFGTSGSTSGVGIGSDVFNVPKAVALGPEDEMYVADSESCIIRVVRDNRFVDKIQANATDARKSTPRGIATAPDGTMYFCDESAHCIYACTKVGVSLIAGGSGRGYFDSTTATDAQFNRPSALDIGPDGVLYICDFGNHVIRTYSPDEGVKTLAGVAGTNAYRDSVDGSNAWFDRPNGVAVSPDGTVYVADSGNNRIRIITTRGAVTTLAGSGLQTYADSDDVLVAAFDRPKGLALGADGTVYIADFGNDRIRAVVPVPDTTQGDIAV
eukprot:m.1281601 g.1281601  ORF g.1281601 m.1281601 type:complete len:1295 (+) comp24773_c2_seq8:252-4136(+)